MQSQSLKLIGLKLSTKTSNNNGNAATDCGGLWQRFISEGIADKITNKSSSDIYAVYFDYDGDHTQPYSFFIGCPVATDAELPEGLATITIPTQQYTTITAKGIMPDCVADAWNNIWQSDINRAYGYDFEVYNELSADWQNAVVAIYISVK
jgi:predicted transcriptional regulator YdeE